MVSSRIIVRFFCRRLGRIYILFLYSLHTDQSCLLFTIGMLTATHTIHKKTVITIAFTYASISSTPVKIELVFIKTVGEYAFTFGIILNKYASSTVPPTHRITPALFCNSDEKRTIRHITHTPNSHHIVTEKSKLFIILLSQSKHCIHK